MQNQHGAGSPAFVVWRNWHLSQLDRALEDCKGWERDADRLGVGWATLSYGPITETWMVLVSADLMDKVLPF